MLRALALLPIALIALADPALAAQAARDPLADLPRQVVGVSGSGNQLSLRLRTGTQERVLRLGDIYADGWVLVVLSNSEATLMRGAQSRRVGLNPTGAVAQEAAQENPSQIQTINGLLRTGGDGGSADTAALDERAASIAAIDARIAVLQTSDAEDADETIGYLRISRAALVAGPQP